MVSLRFWKPGLLQLSDIVGYGVRHRPLDPFSFGVEGQTQTKAPQIFTRRWGLPSRPTGTWISGSPQSIPDGSDMVSGSGVAYKSFMRQKLMTCFIFLDTTAAVSLYAAVFT